MSNRGAAIGAEDTVDGMTRGAFAGPALGGTVNSQRGLGNDGDQSYMMLAIGLRVAKRVGSTDSK